MALFSTLLAQKNKPEEGEKTAAGAIPEHNLNQLTE
jgi:hypothetical protein